MRPRWARTGLPQRPGLAVGTRQVRVDVWAVGCCVSVSMCPWMSVSVCVLLKRVCMCVFMCVCVGWSVAAVLAIFSYPTAVASAASLKPTSPCRYSLPRALAHSRPLKGRVSVPASAQCQGPADASRRPGRHCAVPDVHLEGTTSAACGAPLDTGHPTPRARVPMIYTVSHCHSHAVFRHSDEVTGVSR